MYISAFTTPYNLHVDRELLEKSLLVFISDGNSGVRLLFDLAVSSNIDVLPLINGSSNSKSKLPIWLNQIPKVWFRFDLFPSIISFSFILLQIPIHKTEKIKLAYELDRVEKEIESNMKRPGLDSTSNVAPGKIPSTKNARIMNMIASFHTVFDSPDLKQDATKATKPSTKKAQKETSTSCYFIEPFNMYDKSHIQKKITPGHLQLWKSDTA